MPRALIVFKQRGPKNFATKIRKCFWLDRQASFKPNVFSALIYMETRALLKGSLIKSAFRG